MCEVSDGIPPNVGADIIRPFCRTAMYDRRAANSRPCHVFCRRYTHKLSFARPKPRAKSTEFFQLGAFPILFYASCTMTADRIASATQTAMNRITPTLTNAVVASVSLGSVSSACSKCRRFL